MVVSLHKEKGYNLQEYKNPPLFQCFRSPLESAPAVP